MSKTTDKAETKDAIIFILAASLLYTWFISNPTKRENYKDACQSYIEEKEIDDSDMVE